MVKQMNVLSNMGLLSKFVGKLTDSRSFMSFPRHEYFTRLLCNLFGKEIENVAKFFNDFFETIYPSIEYFDKEEIIIEPASIEELLEEESKH